MKSREAFLVGWLLTYRGECSSCEDWCFRHLRLSIRIRLLQLDRIVLCSMQNQWPGYKRSYKVHNNLLKFIFISIKNFLFQWFTLLNMNSRYLICIHKYTCNYLHCLQILQIIYDKESSIAHSHSEYLFQLGPNTIPLAPLGGLGQLEAGCWSSISNFQVPLGFSSQKWTDRKAHWLKPPLFMSEGRLGSKVDLVPLGEVRWMTRLPRR